jgi:hypothetical protein
VIQALKQAGRVNPSNDQITDATAYQFRRVKSDIASKSSRHEALATNTITTVFPGVQRHTWPTDAQYIRSASVLSGPEKWEGVATAGGNGQITLAVTVDEDPLALRGKYIALTSGTGANQIRQISSYDNATKLAFVVDNWTTNPINGTTYKIVDQHTLLWKMDKGTQWSALVTPGDNGRSYQAAMQGRELWLERAPETLYILWWDYWAHLDYLDNAGAVFLRHLRSYYSLWSQGVTAWLCQRYDEDRYQTELAIYDDLLKAYAAESAHVHQTQFHDV